jgi:hypothetical protein
MISIFGPVQAAGRRRSVGLEFEFIRSNKQPPNKLSAIMWGFDDYGGFGGEGGGFGRMREKSDAATRREAAAKSAFTSFVKEHGERREAAWLTT